MLHPALLSQAGDERIPPRVRQRADGVRDEPDARGLPVRLRAGAPCDGERAQEDAGETTPSAAA